MSTEQKHPTPAPNTPAPSYSYPPQAQMPQQPMVAAAPGQQVVYDAQGNAFIAMAAPGQQGQPMMHPPPMIAGGRRNQALINQYQNTIRDNEIGGIEICWFLCCGFFGLICCLPKYNASQEAKTKLQVELAKPA
ncbi:hypothetical protein BGZ95_000031 [Linnemannia exigua]|uniref:Uncharacterized protein n=1 Tax=Linnemannia exigua TaxID=604196 RepID=A0AAD4DMD1_9FUNG|nr:hypothetical protein BGZ95_000031 [Linnemannia exigua]